MPNQFETCPNCGGKVWYSLVLPFPEPYFQIGVSLVVICTEACGYDTMIVGIYDWYFDEYRQEVLDEKGEDIKDLGYWKSSSVKQFREHLINKDGFVRDLSIIREITPQVRIIR